MVIWKNLKVGLCNTLENKFLKHIPVAVFAAFVLAVGGYSYVTEELPRYARDVKQNSQLVALLPAEEIPLTLGEAAKESDCVARGPLPDPDCTPGAVFGGATREEICVKGYSSTVRNVPVRLKKKVFARYGIAYPVPFGSYEIDHLIPLSLGGSNDIANLWPKSAEPFPGFYEKNITGNYLLENVCAGAIALTVAQQRIANDWFLIYTHLSEATITELKGKYKNWAASK